MSGKLDQSLDDIVSARRVSSRRRGRPTRRVVGTRSATATAPVGGVSKTTKTAKATVKATASTNPLSGSGESKIVVSGLPSDVTDVQIKDYFSKTIGPVKRVWLTYGPEGRSRGIATIAFSKPGSAVDAATRLNGVKVDNKAMKIEVIVSADQAPAPVQPKGLGDRIAQPKSAAKAQPKPASATKTSAAAAASRRGRGRKVRTTTRGKPKTAEELDAEMKDYFEPTPADAGAVNGAANQAVATGGDTGMAEDEIL